MAIKHDWYRDDYGEIDIFRLSKWHHNGPECMRCHYVFCHHCFPEGYNDDCWEQTPYLFEAGAE